jgi:HlyD family secretion protein
MRPKLKPLQSSLAAMENAGSTRAMLRAVDFFIDVVGHRTYSGHNEAVASAYAPLRMSLLFVLGVMVVTLVFGGLVPIDSAAIAKGTVTVLSKRKTVQHLEGGIIKDILVKDGDVVRAGQPLLEISDVAPKANRSIVQEDLWTQRAAEARLKSLREDRDAVVFSDELMMMAKTHPDLDKTLLAQRELFATQREGQIGKLKTLEQRIAESKEEITGLQAQIRSADGQLAYIQEESTSVADLLKEGLATKPRLLALQRQAEELKGTRGQNVAQIAKAEQGITETQMQIINQRNDFSSQIAEELKDVQSKIGDDKEKLSAAADVMERTIITAPSEGIITGLKYHTIGGVINAGAPIMDIVPQNEQLVLEVKIQPTDIDVVKVGMESRVVFPAYRARRMPLFTGKVTQVSADAFTEQDGTHAASYYTARIEVDAKQVDTLDSPVNLYPGMPADVYIKTGARSFLSYLLAPVTDSMQHAFKEE